MDLANRSVKEMRDELDRLMAEQIESLKKHTFGGISEEEFLQQEERLKRIRELSADFLAALKRKRLVVRTPGPTFLIFPTSNTLYQNALFGIYRDRSIPLH